jgi:hypothetical protein
MLIPTLEKNKSTILRSLKFKPHLFFTNQDLVVGLQFHLLTL